MQLLFYNVGILTLTTVLSCLSKYEQGILELEYQNNICCMNKLKCCEVSMMRNIDDLTTTITAGGTKMSRSAHLEDKGLCQRNISIRFNLSYDNESSADVFESVVINKASDGKKLRDLRKPYLIKIKQHKPQVYFCLLNVGTVNSEPREVVYNKHDGNYTGCSVTDNPTCGIVTYGSREIPFSRGFCCSCEERKNQDSCYENDLVVNEGDKYIIYTQKPLDNVPDYQDEKNTRLGGRKRMVKLNVRLDGYNFLKPKHVKRIACDTDGNTTRPAAPSCLTFNIKCPYTHKLPTEEYNILPNLKPTTSEEQLQHTYESLNIEKYINAKLNLKEDEDKPKNIYYSIDPEDLGPKNGEEGTLYIPSKPDKFCLHKTTETINEEAINRHFHSRMEKKPLYNKYNCKEKIDKCKKLDEKFDSEEYNHRTKQELGDTCIQIRGGQNCEDTYTPSTMDPVSYHESAHCLRFSNVWFTVHRLDNPSFNLRYTIKIYKRESVGKWMMIAPAMELNSEDTYYEDNGETPITISIHANNPPQAVNPLESQRILVPTETKSSILHRFPETRNGPKEYLVVPPNMIAIDGSQCDKIGVSYKAFTTQRRKCFKPRGTCLSNQPKHLWHEDTNRESKNMKGKYFLKYHVDLKNNQLKRNQLTRRLELHVKYNGEHCMNFNIMLSAVFPRDVCKARH